MSSSDPTYGFGPKDGYVFQKAFVEFFVDEKDKDELAQRIEEEGEGFISYFAGNREVSFAVLLCRSALFWLFWLFFFFFFFFFFADNESPALWPPPSALRPLFAFATTTLQRARSKRI